jgi:hypothetical protein
VLELVVDELALAVLGEVRPGVGGWGMGQGAEEPPGVLLALRSSSRDERILIERSHSVASRGQFSSGALGGCMPKPWPPVA